MPVYEYGCLKCGKKFAKLVGMVAGAAENEVSCPKCGSADVKRLISRFTRVKSEDERLESFEEAAYAGADDPAAMSRLMREMGREIGDDGEGDIDEFLEESERELYDGTGDESEL